MGVISDAAVSRGDLMKRLDEIEARLDRAETARRSVSTAIGSGGLRVRGGAIVIQDASGNETMRLSTDGLTLTGLLEVLGGGDIRVAGGRVVIENNEGTETFIAATDALTLQGLLQVTGEIIAENEEEDRVRVADGRVWLRRGGSQEGRISAFAPEEDRVSVRLVPPFLTGDGEGNALIVEGESGLTPGGFFANVQGDVVIGSAQGNVFIDANGSAQMDTDTTIFMLPGLDPINGSFSAYAQRNIIFAADSNGNPIADPNLGNFAGTDKGTYTSFVETSNSPNCHIFDASGRIAVSTSSIRGKRDIEDLPVDPAAVLRLRPRTWRDRGEVEADPDTDRWQVGLVAEEVVEAGLPEFVEHDPDGQPRSIAYDRLVVALLEVVREQQARLDALDGGAPQREPTARKPIRRAVRATLPLPMPDRAKSGSVRRSGTASDHTAARSEADTTAAP